MRPFPASSKASRRLRGGNQQGFSLPHVTTGVDAAVEGKRSLQLLVGFWATAGRDELSHGGARGSNERARIFHLSDAPLEIRAAGEADRLPLARLFAAVADERDGIASEPPIDVEERAASWSLDGTLVAKARGEIIGLLHVEQSRFGVGEIGMLVAREWRGRGVCGVLLAAAIEWAREQGLHKLSLGVFTHNAAAIGLYRKFGFVEEGLRVKHYRRASGELWDSIEMGLLL